MVYSLLLNKFSISIAEGEGGLFDFDATLPFMALLIVSLVVILNVVFFKPLTKVSDDRDSLIQGNLTEASATLSKAEELAKQLEENLVVARKEAQSIITSVQSNTRADVEVEINQAKTDTEKLIASTKAQILVQKEQALTSLEGQVDDLSSAIEAKLLMQGVSV
jgi:F-type H+-transporting ATPase subunit b